MGFRMPGLIPGAAFSVPVGPPDGAGGFFFFSLGGLSGVGRGAGELDGAHQPGTDGSEGAGKEVS